MDQFLSQMTMQMTAPKVSTPSTPKSEASNGQDNQFQKLVDQKRQALDNETNVQQPVKDQEGAAQEEAPVQENTTPTNEQMLLAAAYAAAQVVIVPVEEAAEPAPVGDNGIVVEDLLESGIEGGTAAPVAEVDPAIPVAETAPVAEEAPQTLPQASQSEAPVQEEIHQEIPAEAPKTVERETPAAPQQQARPVEQRPEQPQVQDAQTAEPVKKEQPVQVQMVQQEEEAVQSETAVQPQPVFREVEAAPVKVGEAAQPQETPEDSGVKEQVGQRISQALQQGETKVELQLNPASLGTVRVELTRSSDGAIHVVMDASSTHTQALLEKHAAGLQSMLGSHSQEVHVEVQHQENPNAHQQPNYDGHNGQPQQEQENRRQQQKNEERHSQDFLQQLRLGLIPLE